MKESPSEFQARILNVFILSVWYFGQENILMKFYFCVIQMNTIIFTYNLIFIDFF